jgi:hypothetical protein
MSQANAGHSRILSSDPTPSELSEMIDGLDAVDPRPPLTDYSAWLAAGAEDADERASFERMRRAVNAPILEKALEDERAAFEARWPRLALLSGKAAQS